MLYTKQMSAIVGAACLIVAPAHAAIHTWDVNEVFSDATGEIQYVELVEFDGLNNEGGVGNGSITSDSGTYSWSNGTVTETANKFYLVATPGFAALPGAPTPDEDMLPNSFVNVAGDTIAFGGFDSCVVPALPTDGVTAYNCKLQATTTNTPTNYSNVSGTVNAAPKVPSMAPNMTWVMLGLMLLAVLALQLMRRPARA